MTVKASEITLLAQNLEHSFGQDLAIKGVSLQVRRGEVVAVTGPSGSGKSTLLHLLGGLDVPKRGAVWWSGERIDTLSAPARAARRAQQLGLIFQHHYLLEDLSVMHNLLVARLLAGCTDVMRAHDLLRSVGLAHAAQKLPFALSGGERQRAAVARALVNQPALVLADEPTGSLDRTHAKAVTNLLLSLARQEGVSILLVTHDEQLAAQADNLLHLVDGQLV